MSVGEAQSAVQLYASDLHFAYQGREILAGVSLSLHAGEVVALLGVNGAGKSTLLKLLLGFAAPHQGEVLLENRLLRSYRRSEIARRIAYVPQMHAAVFPYKVREIVLLGRIPVAGMWGNPGKADRDFVDAVLERLGIVHLAERAYTEISGGERQLTMIARALAQGARLLVLDEPMAHLDYGHQLRLLEKLGSLAAEGYGVLQATHHPEHVLLASHRAVLLKNGRVEADGPPAEVITAAAIEKLYGVRVEGYRCGSRTAFFPSDRAAGQGQ